MRHGIYTIRDNVAKDILGGLFLHKADAPAVRMFHDAASNPQSIVAMHPEDFDLVELGHLDVTELRIYEGEPRIVLSGATWKDMRNAADKADNKEA